MALVSATPAQYDAFLAKYGYTVTAGEKALLSLAFTFLNTLPFCSDAQAQTDQITEAQCFIAYAMSANGGSFNPAAMGSDKVLIEKNLGRSAIVKKYKSNDLLTGTDSMSLLRKVPMALALLDEYLCPVPVTADGTFTAGAFVV